MNLLDMKPRCLLRKPVSQVPGVMRVFIRMEGWLLADEGEEKELVAVLNAMQAMFIT